MEEHKRRNFEKAHPGVPFPSIQAATPEEVRYIRRRFVGCLGLKDTYTGLDLARTVAALSSPIVGINAADDHFDLMQVLGRLGLQPESHVFLNWYRFDRIDKLRTKDLTTYFSDFWYPSSDDIEIFDNSWSWIVSIFHDGTVSTAGLKRG
jgi:hypothetical protein